MNLAQALQFWRDSCPSAASWGKAVAAMTCVDRPGVLAFYGSEDELFAIVDEGGREITESEWPSERAFALRWVGLK